MGSPGPRGRGERRKALIWGGGAAVGKVGWRWLAKSGGPSLKARSASSRAGPLRHKDLPSGVDIISRPIRVRAAGASPVGGVLLLKGHLTESNVDELIAASARKTRRQIEQLLADRAPRQDLPTRIEPIDPASTVTTPSVNLAPGPISITVTKLEPLGARRIGLHTMIDDETSDLLQRAQELLGHQQGPRDVPMVLKRGLQLLVTRLEKRKFAATDRPRRSTKQSVDPEYIPARVKRAVYARDGGQCTYVCPQTGKRCSCRSVEYDHIIPRGRGGRSTEDNLRLRCRAHNQLAAEQVFGRGFMDRKRGENEDPVRRDLVSGLRGLGYRAKEAREAADHAMRDGGGSLEQRMRSALAFFKPRESTAGAGF